MCAKKREGRPASSFIFVILSCCLPVPVKFNRRCFKYKKSWVRFGINLNKLCPKKWSSVLPRMGVQKVCLLEFISMRGEKEKGIEY